ncbi:hypothetical protein AB8880_12815 [Alphaproteobacteria bacterium LSUCC0684]
MINEIKDEVAKSGKEKQAGEEQLISACRSPDFSEIKTAQNKQENFRPAQLADQPNTWPVGGEEQKYKHRMMN